MKIFEKPNIANQHRLLSSTIPMIIEQITLTFINKTNIVWENFIIFQPNLSETGTSNAGFALLNIVPTSITTDPYTSDWNNKKRIPAVLYADKITRFIGIISKDDPDTPLFAYINVKPFVPKLNGPTIYDIRLDQKENMLIITPTKNKCHCRCECCC